MLTPLIGEYGSDIVVDRQMKGMPQTVKSGRVALYTVSVKISTF